MAGFVHDVQKKQHRERAQPQKRKRLGLLEKKKDYRLRAADFHKKEAQLKYLKDKAKNYNEDEYYHAMTRKKTDDRGILVSDRPESETLTEDEVKLMKTQDAGYLATVAQRERKLVERELQNGEVFRSNGKHTVFVESEEQLEQFDPVKFFDTDESLLNRRENRLRRSQLAGKSAGSEVSDRALVEEADNDSFGRIKAKRDLKKLKRLAALEGHIEREKKLRQVNARVELQRELMKKGNKKKVVTKEGKTVFKWKNQRKR